MSWKKFYLLLISVLVLMPAIMQAQTLFSYGGNKVSKEEFLAAFNKNNPGKTASRQELEEYLELYIRYRLKIQWAYQAQLDTLPSIQLEWERFRNQVAGQYLTDDSTVHALIKEAIDRSGTELLISHIYVAIGTDSTAAKAKINAARAALISGETFEKVALQFSEDPAVLQNKGSIGWISAFTLPYELENLAYLTQVNQISPVYRSTTAFHVFFVQNSRPSIGKTSIAHLFLEVPENSEVQIREKADSLFKLIVNGADFAQLVYQFSNDNASYMNGGELLPFQAGTYDPAFEAVVSKLEKPGSISRPYRSSQGYHIIKLLSREVSPEIEKEAIDEEIRNRVLASDRYQIAKEVTYLKASKLTGLKLLPVTDIRNPSTPIATIGRRKITEGEFQQFRKEQSDVRSTEEKQLSEQEERANYIRQQVMQEYLQNLEIYRPDFAAQLKDFREGTLIFEAMQQQIWDSAATDEKGLQAYFTRHADRYKWKESFRGVLFTCSDQATATTLFNQLKEEPRNWYKISSRFKNTVLADSGRYEYDQLPFQVNPETLSAGSFSRPQQIEESEQFGFVYCQETLPANLPRSFENARGYVLNDYQLQLEEDWMQELKKTYPVKINKAVLNSLNR